MGKKMVFDSGFFGQNLAVSKSRNFFAFRNRAANEAFEILLYSSLLLLVPFLLHHQLLVGTFVNALLIKSALDHASKKIFVLSFLPSLSALSSGFVFGSLSPMLVYMLPFIWAGNLLLALGIKKLFVGMGKNYLFSAVALSSAKSVFLFCSALVFFYAGLVPSAFLLAFGPFQLITAFSGSVLAGFSRFRAWGNF